MAAALMRGSALSAFTGRMGVARRMNAVPLAPRPAMLMPVVTGPSCSFLGGSMARPLLTPSPVRGRGALLVMANAKKSLGCTKQGTRRARRRTSGFRTRMASPTGRKVLKLRRKRGRKNLCPASERSSGGKKQ